MELEPRIDFIFLIAGVALGQGLFFGIYLLLAQFWKKHLDHFFLGLILLMLTFEITHDLLVHSGLILYVLFFHGLGGFFKLALYPTIIMYLLVIKGKNKWIVFLTPLYVPFIVTSFFWLKGYFAVSIEEKEYMLRAFYALNETNPLIRITWEFWFLNVLYPLCILIIAIFILVKNRKIGWLLPTYITYLLIGGLVFSIALKGISFQSLELFSISNREWTIDILFWTLTMLLIIILLLRDYVKKYGGINLLHRIKYKNSGLTPTKAKVYVSRAQALMVEEELFTIKNFRLEDLASRLEVNSSYLSQSFSQVTGTNFTDFINSYRIEKARQLLAKGESKRFTIEAIAQSVGFNSRSAFYRAFGKHAQGHPKDLQDSRKRP
ncbi:helix-turn-helix transcriptional regulator [Ulvibacterium sp.]|uniref:helix-turn-helix transcriptional regulator n=1 Tax=Ulvibacterium sp. TaxID=2665914 RepID=UPI00260E284F|nr:helix-turn-helix transcriptional regulator [Ulvibacterium sp.]